MPCKHTEHMQIKGGGRVNSLSDRLLARVARILLSATLVAAAVCAAIAPQAAWADEAASEAQRSEDAVIVTNSSTWQTKYYTSLQAAIDDIGAVLGGHVIPYPTITITLQRDLTESVKVTLPEEANGYNIAIDLNGHMLENESGKDTIHNSSSVALMDSKSSGAVLVRGAGVVAVRNDQQRANDPSNDASISINATVRRVDDVSGSDGAIISNQGYLSIDGGTVEAGDNGQFHGAPLIVNGWEQGEPAEGPYGGRAYSELKLAGGQLIGGSYSVLNAGYGSASSPAEGGSKLYGAAKAAVYNYGRLSLDSKVSNGEDQPSDPTYSLVVKPEAGAPAIVNVQGSRYQDYSNPDNGRPGQVSIINGQFDLSDGGEVVKNEDPTNIGGRADIEISGGVYSVQPENTYLKAGCVCLNESNDAPSNSFFRSYYKVEENNGRYVAAVDTGNGVAVPKKTWAEVEQAVNDANQKPSVFIVSSLYGDSKGQAQNVTFKKAVAIYGSGSYYGSMTFETPGSSVQDVSFEIDAESVAKPSVVTSGKGGVSLKNCGIYFNSYPIDASSLRWTGIEIAGSGDTSISDVRASTPGGESSATLVEAQTGAGKVSLSNIDFRIGLTMGDAFDTEATLLKATDTTGAITVSDCSLGHRTISTKGSCIDVRDAKNVKVKNLTAEGMEHVVTLAGDCDVELSGNVQVANYGIVFDAKAGLSFAKDTTIIQYVADISPYRQASGYTAPQTSWSVEGPWIFTGWLVSGSYGGGPQGPLDKAVTNNDAYATFKRADDILRFRGGSLRMADREGNQNDASKQTDIRFGYNIRLPFGNTPDANGAYAAPISWGWKAGARPDKLNLAIEGKNRSDSPVQSGGDFVGYESNAVITGVPAAGTKAGVKYTTPIYVQGYVTYETADGTTVTATGSVQQRSVAQVAQAIKDAASGSEQNKPAQAEVAYADEILAAAKKHE